MNAERIKEIADEMEQYVEAIRTNVNDFSVSILKVAFELYAAGDVSITEMNDDTVYDSAKDVLRIFKAIYKLVDVCKPITWIEKTEDFDELMELVDDLEKELKEENNNE